MKTVLQALFLLFFCSLVSCNSISKIRREVDLVKSSKRISSIFYHSINGRNSNTLVSAQKTLLKEISGKGAEAYTIFDNITLTSKSVDLQDSVYLLIDNTVYPMEIASFKVRNSNSITERKQDFVSLDSTKISAVVGHTIQNNIDYLIEYKLSKEIIEKIKTSKKFQFRYYAGPNMYTLPIRSLDLNRFKRVLTSK